MSTHDLKGADATPGVDSPEHPDYWYLNRHDLEPGQIFLCTDGSLVKLDGRVPGDGTKWYVADWLDGWFYMDTEIEPGDLRGLPLGEPQVTRPPLSLPQLRG